MVPPEAETVAVPLEFPQVEFVVEVESDNAVGSFTVAVAVAVQPLASVTVTEKLAAQRPVRSSEVAALLHE